MTIRTTTWLLRLSDYHNPKRTNQYLLDAILAALRTRNLSCTRHYISTLNTDQRSVHEWDQIRSSGNSQATEVMMDASLVNDASLFQDSTSYS